MSRKGANRKASGSPIPFRQLMSGEFLLLILLADHENSMAAHNAAQFISA
jgi:hypothetical protein